MNNQFLKEEMLILLDKWQKFMRLQDWVIKLDVTYQKGYRFGFGNSTAGNKRMNLRLQGESAEELEAILIHELTHLHFPMPLNYGDYRDIKVEEGVTMMADTICRAAGIKPYIEIK